MQTDHEMPTQFNHKHRRRRRTMAAADDIKRPAASPWAHQETPNPPRISLPNLSYVLISLLLSLLIVPNASLDQRLTPKQQSLPVAQNSLFMPGHDLSNFRPSELTPVDTVVYQVKAFNSSNPGQRFTYTIKSSTFSIDERTGELTLIKPLDRETTPIERVSIFLFTSDDVPLPPLRKNISIEDVDDSAPVFQPHKYSTLQGSLFQVSVSESAPIGSIVLAEIIVTDADEGPNAELVFECRARHSSNSACDVFSIESHRLSSSPTSGSKYSASVRTKKSLDYEQVQGYKLALVARGRLASPLTGTPLETEVYIDIDVMNIQDEGPVFINAPYSLSVREGLPSGTKLLNILVQDGDAAPQRDVNMLIVPGPYVEFFQLTKDPVDQLLWFLETNATIDRESPLISGANNMLTIQLLAAELNRDGEAIASEFEIASAASQRPDSTGYNRATLRREDVTIVVLDLPDSRPVFVRASTGEPLPAGAVYVFNVSESIETGASLPNLDLAVHDLDQGVNSRFNLSLVDVDIEPLASNVFSLESEIIYGKSEIVLSVLNSSLLDHENPSTRSYRFNLVASKASLESGGSPLAQDLQVRINIVDANDNAPEFDQDQYLLEVPEDAKPGTLVAMIRATDRDSGVFGRVEHVLSGFGASRFKLHPTEGRIFVADCGIAQCLDYEQQSSYSLNYEARDGGGRTRNASVIINIIDINDHAPKFSEPIYRRELISDNLSSKHNYITPQLIVRAKDADGPTQGRNNVTYRIRNSNLTSLDVDPVSGLVYLASPIDLIGIMSSRADKRILFEAEVVAVDNGSPPLNSSAKIQLVLKGNRDGAPVFKQDFYQAVVRENQPKGKAFFKVQANDPDDKDSQLRYSLGRDLNDIISINPISGELSFKTKVDYDDFKASPFYNVSVIATDNSKPYPLKATATVSIQIQDVNDKPPKFEENEYKATLVQGVTKLGDNVMNIRANDPDKTANLNYSLLVDELFMYDRSGQNFTLEDLANASVGYLSQMSKSDRAQLVGNLRNLFRIHRQSGAIELQAEPDYSFIASITIPAHVVDLNQEIDKANSIYLQQQQQQQQQEAFVACTFVLQTHVDRSPIFAPPWSMDKREYRISIMEELPVGSAIYSLLARDPIRNTRIESFEKTYESDPRDFFRVDRMGIVTVNKRIDFEELPGPKRFNLTIKALTEDIYFSVAHLVIQVMDLNDNAPQFKSSNYSVSLSEASVYPKELLAVKADDRDSAPFNQVHYSLSTASDLFAIDSSRGAISVRKGATLDRDTEPFHVLLVTASDCATDQAGAAAAAAAGQAPDKSVDTAVHLQPSSSNCRKTSTIVNVTLIDENDNDPVFANVNKFGEFEALVSETVSVGSIVTRVSASDPDEGPNGQVNYEIVRADDRVSQSLRIDRDGFVSIGEPMAGLGRSTPYRVSVRAFDSGKPISRHSYATLLLKVEDVVSNDGIPRFVLPRADEIIYLSENTGPNEFVYQVQAVDYDEEASGKLMYKLSPPSDIFEINPFEGLIKTQPRANLYLDRELVPNYTLIVVAQDLGSPPKQAHQVLTIKLTDLNDNEPYFERAIDDPPLTILVEEETTNSSSSPIGTIQAIDKDEGQNALIGYEIIEGNQANMFRLEYDSNSTAEGNNACRIYATGRLDREQRESYTLTIKAVSISKLRHTFLQQQQHQQQQQQQQALRDPLGGRNPFNQYNASDLSKIRVNIELIDINDNRPVFGQQLVKSVVDSSAEVYSQLMVFQATDLDSSSAPIRYSILDVLYYSDAKLRLADEYSASSSASGGGGGGGGMSRFAAGASIASGASAEPPVSMGRAFDVDPWAGIVRNSVSMRPFIDGYFEIYVKADSGQQGASIKQRNNEKCTSSARQANSSNNSADSMEQNKQPTPFSELENCNVAVAKAIVFVTHQRETFRFVFNKTKLNDRLDEFKRKIEDALDEFVYQSPPAGRVAATSAAAGGSQSLDSRAAAAAAAELGREERLYLNTFNTDFYERDDGSLDFSTLTSCSQLVKFGDQSAAGNGDESLASARASSALGSYGNPTSNPSGSPNEVINYDRVLKLLKELNQTQFRNQKTSLFEQYGVINLSHCVSDKTLHKMTPSERAAIYLAIMIAVVGLLLAFIVSRMRKSYERNLRVLQRSKYQYMSPRGLM